MYTIYENCRLCPRNCGKNRNFGEVGICGRTSEIFLARASLHMWEEPCISGKSGSGTVFFSGCSMHCVFCQNGEIANGKVGKRVTTEHLIEIFLKLQEKGANNINLVTADHYVPTVADALAKAKAQGLRLPIVYNTGSYITTDALRCLEGLIDIYLPDFKYYSSKIAQKYAKAKDYPAVAKAAIAEMVRQTGKPIFYNKEDNRLLTAEEYNDFSGNEEILLKKGTIVRHLLLPDCVKDSKDIIRYLLENYGTDIYISILNQYTPVKKFIDYPELNRKITESEYEEVIDFAIAMGIENGFVQEGNTADESFIPAFDYEGI
ncbi:MAG: radical SAM protein [Lachnospiraceae bacterium]|nr:radical SAM protein [Lachnospiraceae bacterium]